MTAEYKLGALDILKAEHAVIRESFEWADLSDGTKGFYGYISGISDMTHKLLKETELQYKASEPVYKTKEY